MKNVLIVRANNRPDGISTKMYEIFSSEIAKNENLNVSTFDVFKENIPHFGQDLFNAFGKLQNGEELNELEASSIAACQKAQDAFKAADIIVYAFPLWNLSIPGALKSFLDYVTMAGFTFKYNEQGQLVHLMSEKKVIILNARGSIFTGNGREGLEMAASLVKNIVTGLHGMEVIEEVIIEGHAHRNLADEVLANGFKRVEEAAAKLVAVYA